MADVRGQALRSLPSVSSMLLDPRIEAAAGQLLPRYVSELVRSEQDRTRAEILAGRASSADGLIDRIVERLRVLTEPAPVAVINGTGVIIQTNLGRSPVSRATAQAMQSAAQEYVALETDLGTGDRGGRGCAVDAMMRLLTGAERTLVVNNNASAVLLMLAATCSGREVVVSRGEAVEIGGGFRIPDVLRQSGATLVEVGTTNRTYVGDYEGAVSDLTAAFLRVHTSNFSIIGFTTSPTLSDLVDVARRRDILALEDAGSGCLLDTTAYGLEYEPTLGSSIDAGVDVVCASGDKLLGGPQAGLILGRKDVVDRIARHPLARAVRADKTCLAGMAATLGHYLRGEAEREIPVWQAVSATATAVEQRALRWASLLGSIATVVPAETAVGGGSLPGSVLPSFAVTLESDSEPEVLARRLRTARTSVVPRIIDDKVAIDARTVLAGQDDALLAAVQWAVS